VIRVNSFEKQGHDASCPYEKNECQLDDEDRSHHKALSGNTLNSNNPTRMPSIAARILRSGVYVIKIIR
jgi:hypothetical protein